MTTFLGIDAGGTRTTVLLAEDQRVIARATGAPGAVRPGRALSAAGKIAAAVRRALTETRLLQADVLVVGAAGVGRDPERAELREGLRNERLASRIVVTGDLDIALEAAFGSQPGIVLVSGTGSVAAARTADGRVQRRGGYGWQMGDEGSGFAIGREALRAVGRARDGRGPPSALTELVFAHPPRKDFDELVRWAGAADPAEIAALAPLVFEAARSGDQVSREIVNAAAEDLAGLVASLIPLFGSRKQIQLVLAGGNLEPGRSLRGSVIERLKQTPRLAVREGRLEPAEGALAMARRTGPG